jgi:hypothetical protein
MKTIKYKTYWSYAGPGIKRAEPLSDFVLDILYLMEVNGVIPPLAILNTVLRGGGGNGGMSPGTAWKPFEISEEEYNELVQALLQLDVEQAKQKHPYVCFERVIFDPELNICTNHLDWLQRVNQKYKRENGS